MKVVLTGATGFVGAEVLQQLLAHPEVDAVTSLTRREVSVLHPKLSARIHSDFSKYDDALMSELSDHGACIWTLGSKASTFDSLSEYERVTHDFTLSLAASLARCTSALSFCYLSGMGADPSESTRFPWERATRHLKGRTERSLSHLASLHEGFSAFSFRPGGILTKDVNRFTEALLRPISVRVETLAHAMIDVALHRNAQPTIRNGTIRRMGRPRTS